MLLFQNTIVIAVTCFKIFVSTFIHGFINDISINYASIKIYNIDSY